MKRETLLSDLLDRIVNDPTTHARWLNTLSFLEYIGFRKIMKSQDAESLNLATLSHAVEEGRHALTLKKLALRQGGPHFDNYDSRSLLCDREAETYFQSLDLGCETYLSAVPERERRRLVYLYVTWLVEVRALQVYGDYEQALLKSGRSFPLKNLLAEEDHHLQQVIHELGRADPLFEENSRELKALETRFYRELIEAIRKEIPLDAEA